MTLTVLKQLAKSVKYQTLYARSKEMANIRLFLNQLDFTAIQTLFLDWLEIYHSLYMDVVMEKDNIDYDIIDDDIRTEAYLLWRHRTKNKKQETGLTSDLKSKIDTSGNKTSVIFKRRK